MGTLELLTNLTANMASKISTFRTWTRDPSTWPVIAVIVGGMSFMSWFSLRTLSKHNDVIINKKKPYRFRTHGGESKFIETRSWTRPVLEFNQETGKWTSPLKK